MEILDRRKVDAMGESRPEELEQYDDFRPTLAGFEPLFDSVLLRELKLPDESAIVTPDAFAEPCLYCEVIAGDAPKGIARILKGIGTTIQFSDTAEGQRYFTVHAQDIIGVWRKQ
jgi:hypothetical protein